MSAGVSGNDRDRNRDRTLWPTLPPTVALSGAHAPWVVVTKGADVGRELADRHYTRQSVGHPMWTRPGYNYTLLAISERQTASWCWWRPKWEAGQERKDGLRVLECTIFRLEGTGPWIASELITAAEEALFLPEASDYLAMAHPFTLPLISGVGTEQTKKRRSRRHLAGHCFREAGYVEFEHAKGRADVWLVHQL